MPRRLLPENREMTVHCISRVVDRNFIFGEPEKLHFHHWMRRLEQFCGVRVITYCLMANHFHLLVRVPDPQTAPSLTVEKIRRLLPLIYRKAALREALQELDHAEHLTKTGSPSQLESVVERYRRRRHNLPSFLKDLKQRFTLWYNGNNNRRGTLWEARYRSVLVENDEQALLTMAAYIDLNPIRAGITDDPKDYRWCGYAEGVAGNKRARRGICSIIDYSSYRTTSGGQGTWSKASAKYRMLLYLHGAARHSCERSGTPYRNGFTPDEIDAIIKSGGKLPLNALLRTRLRSLTEGAVFGSEDYVEEFFAENHDRFGPRRKTGARTLSGGDWGNLRVLRDLKNKPPKP